MASNVKQGPGAKHGGDGHGHDDHDDHGDGGHGDHGGGGHCPPPWILTFADMAVLLMSFFVIMLVSAKTDQPKFNAFAAVMRQTLGAVEPMGKVNGGPSVINLMPTPESGQDVGDEPGKPTSDDPSEGANPAAERRDREAKALGQMIQDAVAKGEVTVRDSQGNDVVVQVPNGDGGAEAFASALEQTIKEQLLGQSDAPAPAEMAQLDVAASDAPAPDATGELGAAQTADATATPDPNAAGEAVEGGAATSGQDAGTAQTFAENAPIGPEAAEAQRRSEIRAELAQIQAGLVLNDAISAGKVEVELEGTSVVVKVGSGGAFASGSADLTEEAQAILDKLEGVADKATRIVVTGHTDNVPVSGGAFDDNWDLAGARANSVVRAIEESGKLPDTELIAVSRGDSEPIADNTTPEGREKNRRIEIKIEYDQPTEP